MRNRKTVRFICGLNAGSHSRDDKLCPNMFHIKAVAFFVLFAGNFKAGPEQGTILKKLCPKEELCFQVLMKDVLRPYVPEYKGHVTCEEGDCILAITAKQTTLFYRK